MKTLTMDYYLVFLLYLCGSLVSGRIRSNSILDRNADIRKQACLEKPLEMAEEEANVVFTGTVRGLYKDWEHPDMMKAQVEIKRIFKGNNVVNGLPSGQSGSSTNPWHKRVIMVDGIGDPHICQSKARKYDTRIFLANKGANGELKLNSSLVRLTLSNLEHTEAVVKNKPFKVKPPPIEAPCERKYCAFGAQCVVDATSGQARCECPETCSQVFAPVCGTDGVTYSNDCELRRASCSQKKRVKAKSQGPCDVQDPCESKQCSYGAQCVASLDGLTARCQCPERCDSYGDSVGSRPVCGSDGKDYQNRCSLNRAACNQMRDITVVYEGKCDPCKGYQCDDAQVCQLDDQRQPICRCNSLCNEAFAPVCGSDGKTYSNECIMRVEACKARKDIYKLFRGECTAGNNPCRDLTCGPGQECHVNRQGQAACICPPSCEPVMRQVCGTDGVSYNNECELMRQSCEYGNRVAVKYVGVCSFDGPCVDYTCSYGATCVVRNGQPSCQCPSCSGEFKPVCGSDGISYNNECKLKAENCEKRASIVAKYQGLCSSSDGCERKRCNYYSICESDGRGGAHCVCPGGCVQVVNKVCGTDGVTYTNECIMRVASCTLERYIAIASQGPCDQCEGVRCRTGASCVNGQCICVQRCPDDNEPVCGSDSITYINSCELQRQACMQSTDIEIQHSGECEDEEGDMEISGSGGDICDESNCLFGGRCEYDAEGPVGCVCNFNCDAIRSPLCGSDGKTYGNECQMKEESCRLQKSISAQPMDNCEDIEEEICDGNDPLIDQKTGKEFDCGIGRRGCPAGSYCHRKGGVARCCREAPEDQVQRSCAESKYGCCPDGFHSAPGPGHTGCPHMCQCNKLGSFSSVCDPLTLQCTCKPGVGGLNCARCEPGFWGLPLIHDGNSGCIPCGCNRYGSVRDDCEQMTGRCVCKPGITGQKCNLCPDGREISASNCNDSGHTPLSCADLQCYFGATCTMEDGAPQCTCPSTCELSEKRSQPVCGTDRMTHGDACQLRIFACRLMRDIRVAHEGPCADDTTTRMPYQRPRKTTRHVSSHVTNRDSHSTLPYGDVGYFCKSDGDCFVDGTYCNSGRCSCRPGYEATADNAACQRSFDIMLSDAGTGYMIPSFSGNSYLELTKIHHGNSRITIEMTFRPLKPDGLLLFAAQDQTGNGDFISLSLVDGHVDFRYDLGSGISRLVSTSPVKMNVYHKVVAQRFGKNGMLQVNGGHEVSGVSPGALRSLNLKSPLFLGGLPIATSKVVENIGTEKSFVGCIEVLRITDEKNTKDYSLVYPASDDINLAVHIDECMDNPCDSSPCQNDGTCMALQTTYQCICPLKYSGLTCTVEQTLACESFPCAEGATCVDLPGGKFTCTCAGDQQGELCDQKIEIDVPQFNGASYLELKTTKNLETALNFEIWFLSTHPDGVLLYNEQDGEESGDFLSLNLVDGYLQFRFDLGSGMADIKSSFPVPLNTWNKVSIIRNEKQGVLTINGAESDNGQSKGSLKQLNLHKKFYLGGFPSAYHPDSGIISGFRGAIQRVYEDNILVDGLYDSSISSAGISPYLGPPCPPESNPCTNGGTCVPVLNDFQCRCTEGFSGKKCESTSVVRIKSNPVSFDGRTYHRYLNNINEKFRAESKNSFEIHFHTLGVRGLLLLVHKSETVAGDYLAIAINSGHLEVSFNLGKELSTELFSLRSPVRVNDGHWHTLTFKRDERSASLQVDNGDVIYGSSKEGANQLDTNGDLWIGGSRNPPEGLPKSYRSGFVGCIESVYVNDSPLDLDTDRVNFSPLNFCDV